MYICAAYSFDCEDVLEEFNLMFRRERERECVCVSRRVRERGGEDITEFSVF
jgi:hypothetical protein